LLAGFQRRRPFPAVLQGLLCQRQVGRLEGGVVAQRPGEALGENGGVGKNIRLQCRSLLGLQLR
jgi:hypothetical protein